MTGSIVSIKEASILMVNRILSSVNLSAGFVSVCMCLHYLMEFLKWSSAGFFTVQLLSNHRSASIGSSIRINKIIFHLHNAYHAL